MSAKDVADRILRDFRTSMADAAFYSFESWVFAKEVAEVMEQPDWLYVEQSMGEIMLRMVDKDDRKIAV